MEEEAEERKVKGTKKRKGDKASAPPLKKKKKKNIKDLRRVVKPKPQSGHRNWQYKEVMQKQPKVVDEDEEEDADDDGDDDDDEQNMIGDVDSDDEEHDLQSVFMTSAQAIASSTQRIFLDSCASTGLLIIRNANILDHMDTAAGTINLTKKGASMSTQGVGTKGSWQGITVCGDSVKNICAVDRLKTAGYGLVQVQGEIDEQMLQCFHHKGMPFVLLTDFFELLD
jgi:hypothetical protein